MKSVIWRALRCPSKWWVMCVYMLVCQRVYACECVFERMLYLQQRMPGVHERTLSMKNVIWRALRCRSKWSMMYVDVFVCTCVCACVCVCLERIPFLQQQMPYVHERTLSTKSVICRALQCRSKWLVMCVDLFVRICVCVHLCVRASIVFAKLNAVCTRENTFYEIRHFEGHAACLYMWICRCVCVCVCVGACVCVCVCVCFRDTTLYARVHAFLSVTANTL